MKIKIGWKYCENGQKIYTYDCAGLNFSLYWDLKGGWYLSEGGTDPRLKYTSMKEANREVRKRVCKAVKDMLKKVEL